MRSFSNLVDFWKFYVEVQNRAGFKQSVMNVYHIQVLQNYRVAAAFAVPVLKIMADMDKNSCTCILAVAKECEEVLADKSVFVMNGKRNSEISKSLEKKVKKADDAVAHAGNICNNVAVLFPENIQSLILEARDICDLITKRKRFS